MSDTSVISAQRGHVSALAFARKAGDEFSTLLGSIATAKETVAKGPIAVLVFLLDHFTPEERALIPIVGSRQTEGSNEPFDRYTTKATVDGQEKTIQGSWVTDFVQQMPEWEHADQMEGYCDNPTEEGCPSDIQKMGSGQRASEKAYWKGRKKNIRTAFALGVMLMHKINAVARVNPARIKVKLPIRYYQADGTLVPLVDGEPDTSKAVKHEVVSNQIRLIDPAKEMEDKVLDVSRFTALKPDAIPQGETPDITNLELTAKRAPKNKNKGNKGKKTTIAVPKTVEDLLNLFNVVSTALDVSTDEGQKLNSRLLEACAAGKDGKLSDNAKDVIETTGDHCLRIDLIWTVIQPVYDQIKKDKMDATNQALIKAAEEKRAPLKAAFAS